MHRFATGLPIAKLTIDSIFFIAVLREGTPPTVCFGGWDGGIRVMEQDVGTNTYVVKGVLRDDSDCEIVRVLSLCTLPGGRIASGGTDKVVRVWCASFPQRRLIDCRMLCLGFIPNQLMGRCAQVA